MCFGRVAAGRRHIFDDEGKLFPAGAGVAGHTSHHFKSVRRIGAVALVVGAMSSVLLGATATPAHGATPIRDSANTQGQPKPNDILPVHSDVEPRSPSPNPSCVSGILSERICVYSTTTVLQIDFTGFLVDGYGVIEMAGLNTHTSLDRTLRWTDTNYTYTRRCRATCTRGPHVPSK